MPPVSPSDPTRTAADRRTAPRDLQRVLVGYLSAAIALLCGVPVLIIGWVIAGRCTGEGFTCLSWYLGGIILGALVAALALPVVAWRQRMGMLFAVLALVLTVVPLWLGDGSVTGGTAFLGPGLAAWVSQPRTLDPATLSPLTAPPPPSSPARHWVPRVAAVLVLSVAIPALGRVV